MSTNKKAPAAELDQVFLAANASQPMPWEPAAT
jgi:hypothetical protein